MKPRFINHALYAALLAIGASPVPLSSATYAMAAIDVKQQGRQLSES